MKELREILEELDDSWSSEKDFNKAISQIKAHYKLDVRKVEKEIANLDIDTNLKIRSLIGKNEIIITLNEEICRVIANAIVDNQEKLLKESEG